MMLDSMSLEEMKSYRGQDEVPTDFAEFWQKELKKVKLEEVSYQLQRKTTTSEVAECYELRFISHDQSEIYSKVLFPKGVKECPVMFLFHGYQGQSPDWSEALKFVAEGVGVVMMDVRGQAGKSTDYSQSKGNTVRGHIIRGMTEGPEELLYRHVYLDIYILVQLVASMPRVNRQRLYSYGESQGGALALVASGLNPEISQTFAVYPFLADFKRVLTLKYDTDAYSELHRYFKFQDPFYETAETIFNTLSYIDVKNFAHLIKAEVTMLCGLQDDVCPPSTQYAIYNRLEKTKQMLIMPEYGHEGMYVGYPDLVFSWATGVTI